MRLLLRTSYWELCHDWGYGSENWVRKIKLLLSLCSSFRGLIKLCLLSLLRWADCNCSKTSWWEGDGKHPGTGKAALLIWPHWTVHGVILKSHVTHGLPSSHHSTAELKARKPGSPFTEVGQYIRIPLGVLNSVPWLTARTLAFCILLNLEMLQPCPENCMVTPQVWDEPVKCQDVSQRLF